MTEVLDSKDKVYTLERRLVGFMKAPRWFLDGKIILVDDQYGWVYPNPYGNSRSIRDKVLKDNIDMVVFGGVIPEGVDVEGD